MSSKWSKLFWFHIGSKLKKRRYIRTCELVSFVLLSFNVYYLDFTLFSMQNHTSMWENHHPVIKPSWSYISALEQDQRGFKGEVLKKKLI